MIPQVYFRHDAQTRDEFEVCSKYFPTVDRRTQLVEGPGTVICRYSALPFNRELEDDLATFNLKPINSNLEHSYIADMGWIYDLDDLTFPTWDRLSDVPGEFPLVVKGKTNSRKFEWDTRMYAPNRAAAMNIMHELWHDPLIGPQGVVFRKYVPLRTFELGVNNMPMTNEWRCFFYGDQLIDHGFYWSTLDDHSVIDADDFTRRGLPVAKQAAKAVSEFAQFFVVDAAEDYTGRWWVVEINDGQMSGLSTIPEDRFYRNLKSVLSCQPSK